MPKRKGKSLGPRKSVTVPPLPTPPPPPPPVEVSSAEDDDDDDVVMEEKEDIPEKDPPKGMEKHSTPRQVPLPAVEVEASGSGGSQKSLKRDYHKAELTTEQEVELMEWYREQECLYDKRDKNSMNTKYKDVLKEEQAKKMGITG